MKATLGSCARTTSSRAGVLISYRSKLYGRTNSRGDDVGVLQQGRHEAFPNRPATT